MISAPGIECPRAPRVTSGGRLAGRRGRCQAGGRLQTTLSPACGTFPESRNPSSPRKRGGRLTFEVQQGREDLSRGSEVEALPWGVVVSAGDEKEVGDLQGGEVGAPGQVASEASDG